MLQDKIALVTGGGTGIGKAIGLQMAKNRAKVAIGSRNRSRLAGAAAELEKLGLPVLPISMDVRKKDDIQRAVDEIVSKWGAIHILVNNAGISGLSLIDMIRMIRNGSISWILILMACTSSPKKY